LHLPDGYELIQVSVEGMPVAAEKGDRPLRTRALGVSRWPRNACRNRVEVLFHGSLPEADRAGRRELKSPPWATGRCDRPLDGPRAARVDNNQPEGATPPHPLEPGLVAAEECGGSHRVGRRHFARRPRRNTTLVSALGSPTRGFRLAMERETGGGRPRTQVDVARQEADSVGKRNAQLAGRLGLAETPGSNIGSGARDPKPGRNLPTPSGPWAIGRMLFFEGRVDSLTLDDRQMERDWPSSRFVAAALWALLACLAVVALVQGSLTKTLERWPHALGVVLGLAWWLWLSPSVLGLGIALASVWPPADKRMTASKPLRVV